MSTEELLRAGDESSKAPEQCQEPKAGEEGTTEQEDAERGEGGTNEQDDTSTTSNSDGSPSSPASDGGDTPEGHDPLACTRPGCNLPRAAKKRGRGLGKMCEKHAEQHRDLANRMRKRKREYVYDGVSKRGLEAASEADAQAEGSAHEEAVGKGGKRQRRRRRTENGDIGTLLSKDDAGGAPERQPAQPMWIDQSRIKAMKFYPNQAIKKLIFV